jgi:hypothetical protein
MSMVNPALASPNKNASTVVPQLTRTPTFVASTVPANRDVNPYGVAFVPVGFPAIPFGGLAVGDVLVSNFNNSDNLQGTGTTIVRIPNVAPTSSVPFFKDSATPGLSTALGVLRGGFVVVGNVPSINPDPTKLGECDVLQRDVGPGALTVINRSGTVVQTLTSLSLEAAGFSAGLLEGPWDLTIADDEGDEATIFVSNVLSGAVTRLDVDVLGPDTASDPIVVAAATQIASGYGHDCNAAAFVVAPTGLALDENTDILYVASTGDNNIFAVQHASDLSVDNGTGSGLIPSNIANRYLHGPLGLVLAPNGDLVSTQGDAINPVKNLSSEIVELTQGGDFVAQLSIAPRVPGAAFGIAISRSLNAFTFAAVNDANNTLGIWTVP